MGADLSLPCPRVDSSLSLQDGIISLRGTFSLKELWTVKWWKGLATKMNQTISVF